MAPSLRCRLYDFSIRLSVALLRGRCGWLADELASEPRLARQLKTARLAEMHCEYEVGVVSRPEPRGRKIKGLPADAFERVSCDALRTARAGRRERPVVGKEDASLGWVRRLPGVSTSLSRPTCFRSSISGAFVPTGISRRTCVTQLLNMSSRIIYRPVLRMNSLKDNVLAKSTSLQAGAAAKPDRTTCGVGAYIVGNQDPHA